MTRPNLCFSKLKQLKPDFTSISWHSMLLALLFVMLLTPVRAYYATDPYSIHSLLLSDRSELYYRLTILLDIVLLIELLFLDSLRKQASSRLEIGMPTSIIVLLHTCCPFVTLVTGASYLEHVPHVISLTRLNYQVCHIILIYTMIVSVLHMFRFQSHFLKTLGIALGVLLLCNFILVKLYVFLNG
jgi:hypothetical protein